MKTVFSLSSWRNAYTEPKILNQDDEFRYCGTDFPDSGVSILPNRSPGLLIGGLLFVLSMRSLILANILIWTLVISRLLHFIAYATAQLHDVRGAYGELAPFQSS